MRLDCNLRPQWLGDLGLWLSRWHPGQEPGVLLHRPPEDHVRGPGATGGGGQLDASPHETSLHLQSEAEARPREGKTSKSGRGHSDSSAEWDKQSLTGHHPTEADAAGEDKQEDRDNPGDRLQHEGGGRQLDK